MSFPSRAASASERNSDAISANPLASARRTTGTKSPSSTATATPTLQSAFSTMASRSKRAFMRGFCFSATPTAFTSSGVSVTLVPPAALTSFT